MNNPNMLDVIWSRLMRSGKDSKLSKAATPAEKRAAARLRAHRAKWDDVDLSGEATRQRRRQEERLRRRQLVSIAKQEAMQRKVTGGSARVRTPADVDAVLG